MSSPRIGLALGGGAARGLAHIEILRAFDDLGLKPCAIAGCSIGALIGAAYASGLSAGEIEDHARALLANPRQTMRHVVRNSKGSMFDLFSLKGPRSMQLEGLSIVDLSLPTGVPQLIEDMPIPFAAVATDFFSLKEIVFEKGPVAEAVAASVAIPGIIAGPEIDGRVLIDGGMTNPVPFDLLKSKADTVVGVDVTGRPSAGKRKRPSNFNLAIGGMVIAFHQIAALKRAADPPDMYIEPAVEAFQAHEFFRLEEILTAARPARDELKRRLELLVEQ